MDTTHLFATDIIPPVKTGYMRTSDTSGIAFAVYDLRGRPDLLAELGEVGCRAFTRYISGLTAEDDGVGRAFANSPAGRLYGRKLLVTQFRGIDC